MRTLLRNCLLLDPEAAEPQPGGLLLEGGRIAARLTAGEAGPEAAEVVDLGGLALAPGSIDLHFHGSTIFVDAAASAEALARDGASCVRHGTTAFLATTVACPAPELLTRVEALTRAIGDAGEAAAVPLGIHLEGPWIAPEAAGAQPTAGIRDFARDEGAALIGAAGGLLRMVTLAPEVTGAADLLALLERRQVVAALGHSRARAAQVDDAVRRGARHVTHLYNAMGPLHHREPGLTGVALTDDRLSCDLICDGVHVEPRMTRLAARVKREGLMLISDRIEPPDPSSGFGSGSLHEEDGAWRLPDGRLAASCLQLDRAMANAVAWGTLTRLEAVAACTLRPARLLGIENERGTLRPGARADLTALDPDGQAQCTWVGGRLVHGRVPG